MKVREMKHTELIGKSNRKLKKLLDELNIKNVSILSEDGITTVHIIGHIHYKDGTIERYVLSNEDCKKIKSDDDIFIVILSKSDTVKNKLRELKLKKMLKK